MRQLTAVAVAFAVTVIVVTGPSAAVVGGLANVGSESGSMTSAIATSDPTASFDYSPSTPNPDDEITLDASDSTDNGTIESYRWDTDGDGDYSEYSDDADDGQTTSVTFDSGGTYTVGLRVTDDNGNTDTTTTTITVDNPAPDASFDYSPSTPNPDDEITLDASGSSDPDGTIESYQWDTDGDGDYSEYNGDASDGQTTSITFDSGGTYTIGLRIEDNGGETDTITRQITVDNPTPDASFEFSPSSPNPDDQISLDASGSSDPDGTIESYQWDTDGDGDYSEYNGDASDGQTTSVTFETGGTYTIGLRIEDNGGETDTITQQLYVDNPAPTASFEYTPSDPNPDDEITLDASGSSDPDGTIESYEWDTDGDGDYSEYRDDASDGQTATISFDSGGTYTVGLRIEDNGGITETTTQQITVDNPAPTADLDVSPIPPNPDDEITLDASGSSDPDGTIESYEWDTDGDGDYSEYRDDASDGQTATISYDSGGEYTVGVRVTDNGGETDTDQFIITVRNPEPTADISVSTDNPNPDDEITLDASGSSDPDGTIESYEWDTDGDGEYGEYRDDADSGQTTTVSYDTEGEYTVGLQVTDNGGITDTAEVSITVNNTAPTASYEVSPSTPNPDDEVVLDASGSSDPDGTIESYQWDTDGDGEFGDYGDSSDGERTTVAFETGGTYEVSLRVDDNGEKYDTVTREINVENPPPTPSIDYAPELPELGEPVQFDGSASTDSDGEIVSYVWYVNSNQYERGDAFTTIFDREGSYNVTLAVTDNGRVTNTTSVIVPVSEPPVSAFEYEPDAIGRNRTVTFDASDAYDPDGTVTTYIWEFGDGETSEGETVSRQFSDLGNHTVNLTVVDDTTLRNVSSQTITVYPIPSASIDADPEQPVEGTEIEFSADSEDAIESYEWAFGDGKSNETGQTAPHVFDQAGEYTVSVIVTSEAGVTSRTSRTISVDRNATFELTSNRGTIGQGETAIITFTISNNIRDRTLNTRLQFSLPDTGVSISSVEGGSVAGRSATSFVTVGGGEQQTLRVRMQFNEPGEYNISGQSVYYYGNQSSSQEQSVGPVNVRVRDGDANTGTAAVGPGFGIASVLAGVLGLLALRRHRD